MIGNHIERSAINQQIVNDNYHTQKVCTQLLVSPLSRHFRQCQSIFQLSVSMPGSIFPEQCLPLILFQQDMTVLGETHGSPVTDNVDHRNSRRRKLRVDKDLRARAHQSMAWWVCRCLFFDQSAPILSTNSTLHVLTILL